MQWTQPLKSNIDKLEKVPSALSNLKGKVHKLDIDKLETIPVDLSKLNDVVKNDVVKKIEYDEYVKKVCAIQTTDISNLVKKADYDKKVSISKENY